MTTADFCNDGSDLGQELSSCSGAVDSYSSTSSERASTSSKRVLTGAAAGTVATGHAHLRRSTSSRRDSAQQRRLRELRQRHQQVTQKFEEVKAKHQTLKKRAELEAERQRERQAAGVRRGGAAFFLNKKGPEEHDQVDHQVEGGQAEAQTHQSELLNVAEIQIREVEEDLRQLNVNELILAQEEAADDELFRDCSDHGGQQQFYNGKNGGRGRTTSEEVDEEDFRSRSDVDSDLDLSHLSFCSLLLLLVKLFFAWVYQAVRVLCYVALLIFLLIGLIPRTYLLYITLVTLTLTGSSHGKNRPHQHAQHQAHHQRAGELQPAPGAGGAQQTVEGAPDKQDHVGGGGGSSTSTSSFLGDLDLFGEEHWISGSLQSLLDRDFEVELGESAWELPWWFAARGRRGEHLEAVRSAD